MTSGGSAAALDMLTARSAATYTSTECGPHMNRTRHPLCVYTWQRPLSANTGTGGLPRGKARPSGKEILADVRSDPFRTVRAGGDPPG